jgi:hypothetical protein
MDCETCKSTKTLDSPPKAVAGSCRCGGNPHFSLRNADRRHTNDGREFDWIERSA